MDNRLKYSLEHIKSPGGEYRKENLRYSTQEYFYWSARLRKGHKGKNKQMGSHQNKKLNMAKENSKIKSEAITWENTIANDTLENDLISKIH